MRPIIFLDIDGVLNTQNNYDEWNKARDERGTDAWIPEADDPVVRLLFDDGLVATLNDLISRTGAAVVVSSSWRNFYRKDFEKLAGLLQAVGIKGEILGPTPCSVPEREAAIIAWLEAFRAEHGRLPPFVILDDFGRSDFRKLLTYLVQTDPSSGLVSDDVDAAIKKLRKQGVKKSR